MTTNLDFSHVLQQLEAALGRFMMGDAEPYKALWSHADDVTIFGGRGAYEVSWDEVGPRIDWIIQAYQGGNSNQQVLATGTSGDLGYSMTIERSDVLFRGQAEPVHMELRVTHIFRREDGAWKIIHRHADPIMAKQTDPMDVLQA